MSKPPNTWWAMTSGGIRAITTSSSNKLSSPPPSKAMDSNLTLCHTLSAIFLLCLLAQRHVQATEYMVGDDLGWDTGNNYLLWSQKYKFSVGDVLVFKYEEGQHDVCQVREETYRSCDPTSGITKIYNSGNDQVNLTEGGKYWFICNITGHCQGGMKFGISVASASPNGGGGGGLAPPPEEQGGGAAGEAVGRGRVGWVLGLAIGGLCLLSY
uniref:LOW QUALITY PROTEIN: basic blue protein n=2 Tax=Elaeis guineensis var. tenera TaxID=51953 RepID=A0A6I9RZF2_ELAGV|nr:LOW QUALITY PROTEIN: basic blue protein [Elaeis guineensis]